MADQELDVQQTASDDGASQEVAAAEGASQEVRQPTATSDGLPDDWTKSEKFRKYQAEQDRKYEALRSQLTAHQQQMEQQRQEAERRAMENMSEEERWQYMLQRERAARTQAEQRIQAYEVEMQRVKVLSELAQKTGAPVIGYLDQAENWEQAQDLAIEWLKKNREAEIDKAVREKQKRNTANAVDLGGGTPKTGSDWESRRQAYLRNKDSVGFFKDLITNRD